MCRITDQFQLDYSKIRCSVVTDSVEFWHYLLWHLWLWGCVQFKTNYWKLKYLTKKIFIPHQCTAYLESKMLNCPKFTWKIHWWDFEFLLMQFSLNRIFVKLCLLCTENIAESARMAVCIPGVKELRIIDFIQSQMHCIFFLCLPKNGEKRSRWKKSFIL